MEGKGVSRCKIVVVGDTQCGKTALLHVFAKDSYPEVRTKKILLDTYTFNISQQDSNEH